MKSDLIWFEIWFVDNSLSLGCFVNLSPVRWPRNLWADAQWGPGYRRHDRGKSAACAAVCYTPPPQPPHDTPPLRPECRTDYSCSHSPCTWDTDTRQSTTTAQINQTTRSALYKNTILKALMEKHLIPKKWLSSEIYKVYRKKLKQFNIHFNRTLLSHMVCI